MAGRTRSRNVTAGAVPAERLQQSFPKLKLPIEPPFPPMEAKSVSEIPSGDGWQYEPKWDGFRCLAFRNGDNIVLQSKSGQPLGRYFPEMVEALRQLPQKKFVLDGELIIVRGGALSFDDLLLRIHPAESRVRKLALETPALLLCFDLLVNAAGKSLVKLPLRERRELLEEFFAEVPERARIRLSPAERDVESARQWMEALSASGLDGVIAKRLDEAYLSGERACMVKIKRIRSADCVVGGFRYGKKGEIGSLLLGLYNDAGELDHVGFSASFAADARKKLKPIVEPLEGGEGFTGKAPGGPSRWNHGVEKEWFRLEPKLVCEVQFDHFSQGRFRHGTKFLRWRPDKAPKQCTFEQVRPSRVKMGKLFAA